MREANIGLLLRLYRRMFLIRHIEEELARRYHDGDKMRCPMHLSLGQEAPAAALVEALQADDHVYSTHRCHAHYLAKGGSVDGLIAELYGKATGCAGGRGGSMHLVDESVGFQGTSAIVGSSVPVAIGSALAFHHDGSQRVAVACFGDAGLESGQLYEAINFAALLKLPIIFFCENNGYSTATPLSQRQPPRVFARVASAMGLAWTGHVETGDVMDMYAACVEARAHTPSYLEVKTYRYREHVGPNYDWDLGYRTREEVEAAMGQDQVAALRAELLGRSGELVDIERLVREETLRAFERAESAPWPT